MRLLRPDPQGAVHPVKQSIHGGNINAYTVPSNVLPRVDALRRGDTPRICVQRKQGGVGDVLMTLPTVKAIAHKYNVRITYATDLEYLDGALHKVLLHNPYIEKVINWRNLLPEEYDAVVELTCPCIAHEKPGAPPVNRIDLFARHASLPLPLADPSIDYFVTEEEKSWAKDYLIQNNLDRYKLVLLQPYSSAVRRDPPVDKVKAGMAGIVSARRDVRVLITTHYTDNYRTDWRYAEFHELSDFDVRKIAALMPLCSLIICPDSAILHLASALHLKTLTLFGPSDPRARVNYHPEAVAIWPAKQFKWSPTWYESNADPTLMCWKVLDEGLISRAALSMLENKLLPFSNDYVTFGDNKMMPNNSGISV